MRIRYIYGVGLAVVFLCLSRAAVAAPCEDNAHRQFDFWLGEWQVHTADGKLAGCQSHRKCVRRLRPA